MLTSSTWQPVASIKFVFFSRNDLLCLKRPTSFLISSFRRYTVISIISIYHIFVPVVIWIISMLFCDEYVGSGGQNVTASRHLPIGLSKNHTYLTKVIDSVTPKGYHTITKIGYFDEVLFLVPYDWWHRFGIKQTRKQQQLRRLENILAPPKLH